MDQREGLEFLRSAPATCAGGGSRNGVKRPLTGQQTRARSRQHRSETGQPGRDHGAGADNALASEPDTASRQARGTTEQVTADPPRRDVPAGTSQVSLCTGSEKRYFTSHRETRAVGRSQQTEMNGRRLPARVGGERVSPGSQRFLGRVAAASAMRRACFDNADFMK